MTATQSATQSEPLKAYWQPGCSSCLRMKEFLQRHGVAFESINVLAEKGAVEDLARLGIRSVPIIRRGDDWANGQVLRDVARIAGIDWGGTKILPPEALKIRLDLFQSAARRFLGQLPDEKLASLLPNRPRSYASLAYHVFSIADAFLDHELLEFAARIARSARRMGLATIGIYSDADRGHPFLASCDEQVPIGGQLPAESYLVVDKIIAVAKAAAVDAIHPGYGFVSERAPFAIACA